VSHLVTVHSLSERRACQLARQPRSTHRYESRQLLGDDALTRQIKALSLKHPRYGYRRITALLRQDGWNVNRKRIHRIWKREGLRVPFRRRRKRRRGHGANSSQVLRSEQKDHVWSYDFLSDMTTGGHSLRVLALVDEYTRECLILKVAKNINAKSVRESLRSLFLKGRMPRYIRSDNGPEFIAESLSKWFKELGVKTAFIEPGSPWENAYIESFNARLRDEFLDRRTFETAREAGDLSNQYQKEYNEERPHSSLSYLTPGEFSRRLEEREVKHNHAA